MADIATARKTLDALTKAHKSGDTAKTGSLLGTLKIAIASFPALPPVFEPTETASDELTIARDTFEIAVLHCVTTGDESAAERNFSQLKPFYRDCVTLLPPSQLEPLITGLNLTRLLVQNRIAEFHVELETVPSYILQSDHVKHAVALESDLMEGAYGSILASSKKNNLPSPEYASFYDTLTITVRDEIATCIEKAYSSITPQAAEKLMSCSASDVAATAAARKWRQDQNGYLFGEEKKPPSVNDIPANELINQTLMYAKELERIV